jgi:hypothetical protein
MLTKFISTPETTFLGKLRNIGLAFTICLFWVAFIEWFITTIYHIGSPYGSQLVPFEPPSKLHEFFFACIVAPLWEELAFRHAPLQIGKRLSTTFGTEVVIPMVYISSAIFGWAHGQGAVSILIQGVMGFIFALVYLKNGYSYKSSVLLHAMWNFMVMFGLPYFVNG